MSFAFGTNAAKTTGGFSLPVTTPTATVAGSVNFSLGGGDANVSKPAPTLTLPTTTTTVAASQPQKSLLTGTVAPTQSSASFSLPTSFSLAVSSTAASTNATTTTASTTSAPQSILATSTVVSSATTGSSASLNFVQLEENINKWAMELQEQEKVFQNQATQVNTWDRLLIANGDKIVSLNNAVERVKMEQQQLDQELDFIVAQQRDLEDCLAPLEKELADSNISDPEREHTYQLAQNIDTQMKQMSEDLKEIIEYLNESNRTQDANDPMGQICRILNAHMNSLQWVDQNIALTDTLVEHVSKLHDLHKRENEQSFHLSYE
uniref:Nucleoporin NSP1-like C-terminal domain-containing protein n=2 Tax=Timema TaxID=61471 RepID=A0A7R9HT99_9NEOP|nr:unnamed protein product [Timema cristinae]CAD7433991.1 unnamed protein product [Timema monikensis]